MSKDSRYKVPSIEKFINRIIGFIFYWRLIWVFIALSVIIVFAIHAYNNSIKIDRLQDFSIVLTGGSIMIGIFYSLINYEHNQIKFKHDVKSSKEILTYSTANKMHENELMSNFQAVRIFYSENEGCFKDANWTKIDDFWKEKKEARLSFIIILNYLECISIGVEQNIMDEMFMKEFFKTLFIDYLIKYGTYIDHMCAEQKTNRIFKHFVKLATKWKNEE
ncbi:MAG: DUF4760 domain-containing protein [Ginsengibacter sp.]